MFDTNSLLKNYRITENGEIEIQLGLWILLIDSYILECCTLVKTAV